MRPTLTHTVIGVLALAGGFTIATALEWHRGPRVLFPPTVVCHYASWEAYGDPQHFPADRRQVCNYETADGPEVEVLDLD